MYLRIWSIQDCHMFYKYCLSVHAWQCARLWDCSRDQNKQYAFRHALCAHWGRNKCECQVNNNQVARWLILHTSKYSSDREAPTWKQLRISRNGKHRFNKIVKLREKDIKWSIKVFHCMEGFWFLCWMQQEVIKGILQSRETQSSLCVLQCALFYPGLRCLRGLQAPMPLWVPCSVL